MFLTFNLRCCSVSISTQVLFEQRYVSRYEVPLKSRLLHSSLSRHTKLANAKLLNPNNVIT